MSEKPLLEKEVSGEHYKVDLDSPNAFINLVVIQNNSYLQSKINCGSDLMYAIRIMDSLKRAPEKIREIYKRGGMLTGKEAVEQFGLELRQEDQLDEECQQLIKKYNPPGSWLV